MTISATIRSAGWVLPRAGGLWDGRENRETNAGGADELFQDVVVGGREVKNYGRFPEGTRSVCSACALGLEGAGYGPEDKLPTAGILAAGFDRTLQQNEAFFRDYVENGRVMGRGNLFIYTLPTSSVAEAAILFGIGGPCLYEEADGDPLPEMVASGCDFLNSGQAELMILLWQDAEVTVCVVLETGEKSGIPVEQFAGSTRELRSPRDVVEYFQGDGARR